MSRNREQKNTGGNALDSGSLGRDYAHFAIPSMLSLVVFSLYAMVDGVFVGRYVGSAALAAVTISAPYISFLFSVGVLLAVGSSTLAAGFLGKGEHRQANELLTRDFIVAACVGVMVSILTLVGLEPLCRMLGAEGETLEYTKIYLGTVAPFAVCVILEYNLELLVKADANPRLAAYTVVGACALHLLLNWIFLSPLHMGILGAGLATGLSMTFSALVFVLHFVRGKKGMLRFVRCRLKAPYWGRILFLGIPDGSAELCVGVMNCLYNRAIEGCFGSDMVACFAVSSYMNTLALNMVTAASQGMQPLVSYHRAQGQHDKCRRLRRMAHITACVAGAVLLVLTQWLAPQISALFFEEESSELLVQSAYVLRRFSLGFFFLGPNIITVGYFTATQRPVRSVLVALCRSFVVQALCLVVLLYVGGGNSIWFTLLVSEFLVFILSTILSYTDEERHLGNSVTECEHSPSP